MAERNGETKSTLLNELESIKGLLGEEKAIADEDIPILREVIEIIEPADPDRPRQPSLFTQDRFAQSAGADAQAPAPTQRPPQPTRATGENPFLPAHIRARLQGNQPAHATMAEPYPIPSQDEKITRADLIEAVVAELRPDLETRLRARLEPLSQDLLLELLTAGDDSQEDPQPES